MSASSGCFPAFSTISVRDSKVGSEEVACQQQVGSAYLRQVGSAYLRQVEPLSVVCRPFELRPDLITEQATSPEVA